MTDPSLSNFEQTFLQDLDKLLDDNPMNLLGLPDEIFEIFEDPEGSGFSQSSSANPSSLSSLYSSRCGSPELFSMLMDDIESDLLFEKSQVDDDDDGLEEEFQRMEVTAAEGFENDVQATVVKASNKREQHPKVQEVFLPPVKHQRKWHLYQLFLQIMIQALS